MQSTTLLPSVPDHGPCKVCLLAPRRRGILPSHHFPALFIASVHVASQIPLTCFSVQRWLLLPMERSTNRSGEKGRSLWRFLLLSEGRHQRALTCVAPVGSDVESTSVVNDETLCWLQNISLQRRQQHSPLITFVAVCTCWIHAALNLNACPDYSQLGIH